MQRFSRGVTTRIAWDFGKLYKPEKISTQGERRKPTELLDFTSLLALANAKLPGVERSKRA